MDPDSRSFIITVIVLLAFAAYFAVTETALSSVSQIRIRLFEERGDKRASRVLFALEHFDKAVTTLLICTNIVHITLAGVVTVYVTKRWGLSLVSLATLLTTVVVFFLGEMLPKSIARRIPHQCILSSAGFLCLLMKLCTPLTFILSAVGNFFSSRLSGKKESTVTEDELEVIIDDMTEEGTLNESESDLITSAIRFRKIKAGEIMTPVEKVFSVDLHGDPIKVYQSIIDQSHSRIPVYSESRNHIAGLVLLRDILRSYLSHHNIPAVGSIMRPIMTTQISADIDELLDEMTKKRENLAAVLDPEGNAAGIITVEDILEELVGEIYDEDDQLPKEASAERTGAGA